MIGESEKVGVAFVLFGIAIGTLGAFLLFDYVLLTFGNLIFLCGLFFIMGSSRMFRFFFKPDKLAATAIYLTGVVLIVLRRSLIGWLVEMYGLWKLFASFAPAIVSSAKHTPLAFLFNLPGIKQLGEWVYDQRRLPI